VNGHLRRRQTAQWARFVRAAELAREHAEHLAEQEPQESGERAKAPADTSAIRDSSSCSVISIDSRRAT